MTPLGVIPEIPKGLSGILQWCHDYKIPAYAGMTRSGVGSVAGLLDEDAGEQDFADVLAAGQIGNQRLHL